MNQKQTGTILIIIGAILAVFLIIYQMKQESIISLITQQQGTCYLTDGTCLHNQVKTAVLVGGIISAALILLGIYLILFDKEKKNFMDSQTKIAHAVKERKKNETESDKFKAFLSGFKEEEQNVIKAIKEQDGIKQSTLRYRTGMSKSSLSLLLKDLEERDIIKRKESGKTNEVYLRKKF